MTAEEILNLAKSQIGIKENPTDSNNVKYNTAYYGREVNGKQYAWCCVFIWWLFKERGASELFYGGDKTASCTTLMNYYKKCGQEVKEYREGDLVFYDWGKKDGYAYHIGIITETLPDGKIKAIEGNTSRSGSQDNGGAVLEQVRGKSQIVCVIRPQYESEENEMRYNTLEEVPDWGKATIQKLLDKDFLYGGDTGLGLTEDMLRLLVINDRAGVYDK